MLTISPTQIIGAVVILWEGTAFLVLNEWLMQTSVWVERKAWIRLVCGAAFIVGIATIGFAISPFVWELSKEATSLTIHFTYGTTVPAMFLDIGVVAYVAIKIRKRWGATEVSKYLETGRDAAEAIAVALVLTFIYHLAVTVPQGIRLDAKTKGISLFRPLMPEPPYISPRAKQMAPAKGDKITLEIGPSTDTHYAFDTRFILTNHNPLTMTKASYTCSTQSIDLKNFMPGLNHPTQMRPEAFGPIENLPSGIQRSLHCDFTAAPMVEQLDAPLVNIWVSYTYQNEQIKVGFRFFALRRFGDKTFVWLPGGAASEN